MARDFTARHIAELPRSGIRKFFDIVAQRKDVISLGVGEPDFDTPWHISRAAVTCLEDGGTHYTSNLGTPELRQAICRYLKRRFKASFSWEKETLVTVGVSEAIGEERASSAPKSGAYSVKVTRPYAFFGRLGGIGGNGSCTYPHSVFSVG